MPRPGLGPPDASNRLVEPIDTAIERLRGSDWFETLRAWRATRDGAALVAFIDQRLAAGAVVFPRDVFRALTLTPLAETRVVVLGQDPYHGPGQAEGLAFSVPAGVQTPPSLRNIFAELHRDLGLARPASGHLGAWAARGVLLLNTSLTVEEARAGSHAKQGWEALTDEIVKVVSRTPPRKVFLLWGAHAQAKAPLVEVGGQAHMILRSNHPSPLSATRPPVPFIGNGHFSAVADFLARALPDAARLDWSLA